MRIGIDLVSVDSVRDSINGPNGERWPNLELDLLPGLDQKLRPPNSQRRAHDVLDRALEQELARTPI
jgi:hypothetical protein